MPPKKNLFSETDLRRVTQSHGIRFEGPVPPANWPKEHQIHFQAARDIQFLQYEEYKWNHQIDPIRRAEYQKRVRKLRDQARDLLKDANPNEPTWRTIEPVVFERFDRAVLWHVVLSDVF